MLVLQLAYNHGFLQIHIFNLFLAISLKPILCKLTEILVHIGLTHLLSNANDSEAHILMMPYLMVFAIDYGILEVGGALRFHVHVCVRALAQSKLLVRTRVQIRHRVAVQV